MTYYTNEGKTYCVVGTAEGTVTSASGVVIASFSANEQNYFTAPAGGFVTISDDTAIVTPVFDLAPSALVGKSSGGDSPSGANSDFVGYIEYDDATGVIVDLSIPKYTFGNLRFNNDVFPENYEWKIDMPYLANGKQMFQYCSNLTEWNTPLPALTDAYSMFNQCTNLTSFSGDLPALTDANQMFDGCTNLTSFEGDLSSLTNGQNMFRGCSGLTSFDGGDLSALTDGGGYMFQYCRNLTSFSSDLSALTNGTAMFFRCYKLTSFTSDLPNLTNGTNMFHECKLDAASVERILSTIPTYTDGSTHTLELYFSSEAAVKFEEITGVTPTTSVQTVSYKGWTIRAMIYNG